jgi:hypothetical protein
MTDVRTRERPILFSGPMVRAILEGRKTQTRRVVNNRHVAFIGGREDDHDDPALWGFQDEHGCWHVLDRGKPPWFGSGVPHESYALASPYDSGDLLWVREAFRLSADQDSKPPSQDWWKSGAWYEADGDCEPSGCAGGAGKLRPSIHMPRWASRLTLRVTSVHVERLQDISEKDAKAEGIANGDDAWHTDDYGNAYKRDSHGWYVGHDRHNAPTHAFRALWNSLNAKRGLGWDENPWVWVVSFERVEGDR